MDDQNFLPIPSILGIQTGGGNIIPINLRFIGKKDLIFSIPVNNQRAPVSVIGKIPGETTSDFIKHLIGSLINPFSEDEKREMKKSKPDNCDDECRKQLEHTKQIQQIDPQKIIDDGDGVDNASLITVRHHKKMSRIKNDRGLPTDDIYQKPENIYQAHAPVCHNVKEAIFLDAVSLRNMTKAEKRAKSEELYTRGMHLYRPDINNSEIIYAALKMLDQAQRLTLDIYPGHFKRIVLPGNTQRDISKIDPEAFVMNPKQFNRFVLRRKALAELRNKNIFTGRTKGILYPERSRHAKNRQRNELGIFD